MIQTSPINSNFKRVCWSAILSGAIVAIGINFLLGLFGIAIGISTFSLHSDGKIVIAFGGAIGIAIGIIASMLTAGYTAGYLGRGYCPKRNLGLLYGFLMWSFAIIISAILIVPLGKYAAIFSNETSRSNFIIPQSSTNTSEPITVETVPSSMENNHKSIRVTATPDSLALSAFLVFIMFFIGAIFSCIGATWGMNCSRND